MFIIDDIIWLDTIVEKLAWKHHILPSEVEEILSGNCRIFKKEKGRTEGEHLYNALGKTAGGRYLSVFFIRKLNNRALIITARDMNRNEKETIWKKINIQKICRYMRHPNSGTSMISENLTMSGKPGIYSSH